MWPELRARSHLSSRECAAVAASAHLSAREGTAAVIAAAMS
jgi:hypothetical protein